MAATQIERSQWAPFLETLTTSLIGKQAEIEIASLDLGDQIEAEWAPLIGISYDAKDDLIEVALHELDHLIRSPRQLFIDYGVGGIVAIDMVDSDGNQQIARFRDPLALPAPSEAAGP
ncbi:MAG TPA: DUF5335 domain-containing protein [Sphingomicrobium sp.]|jgi:hypothetical protein|nr:DUF5335 domain-containing protein [Sphingomicrobium sp.]